MMLLTKQIFIIKEVVWSRPMSKHYVKKKIVDTLTYMT